MDGLENKAVQKGTALGRGLLQAVAIYLVYLAVSLTDIWGYLPDLIQLVAYVLVALAMIIFILRSLNSADIYPLHNCLKAGFLSVILLLVAVTLAGPDRARLLTYAVKPRAIFDYGEPQITLTVLPPVYSGRQGFTENILVEEPDGGDIKLIPEGSKITVLIRSVSFAPLLIAGEKRVDFIPLEAGGYKAEFTLKDEASWQIKDGSRQLGQWSLLILEDTPPIIERMDFRPLMTGDGLFALALKLRDDYSLTEVAVSVAPQGTSSDSLRAPTIIPITDIKNFSGELYINFSAAEYAGEVADIILEVSDQAGQTQQKVLSNILLPKMEFSDPLARRLMTIRKEIKQKPTEHKKLARELRALGLTSDEGDNTSSIFYMALRSAYWRLLKLNDQDEINSVRDILWNLAVNLDRGEQAQFKQDILANLLALRLNLYQGKNVDDIREDLRRIDQKIILFLRASRKFPSPNQEPNQENVQGDDIYDVPSLRKIYGKILTHTHNKEFNQAAELVSFLEYGFIYSDRDILSNQGFGRFQTAIRAQKAINVIEETQKQVMLFVLRNTVKMEGIPAKSSISIDIKSRSNDIESWISIQKKLGGTVDDLGRSLQQKGINAAGLTVATSDLVRDVVHSMKAGNMEAAAGYQSEILILLKNLRNILELEMNYRS